MKEDQQENLKVVDMFPGLSTEIAQLLVQAGRQDLLLALHNAEFLRSCDCNDEFCLSFYTRSSLDKTAGSQPETVPLDPKEGMINLDLVEGQIVYIEVLNRNGLN